MFDDRKKYTLTNAVTGGIIHATSGIEIGRSSGTHTFPQFEMMSASHFRIVIESGDIFVEDLGSLNGTRLNGKKLKAGKKVKLKHGDHIKAGEGRFTFSDGSTIAIPDEPKKTFGPKSWTTVFLSLGLFAKTVKEISAFYWGEFAHQAPVPPELLVSKYATTVLAPAVILIFVHYIVTRTVAKKWYWATLSMLVFTGLSIEATQQIELRTQLHEDIDQNKLFRAQQKATKSTPSNPKEEFTQFRDLYVHELKKSTDSLQAFSKLARAPGFCKGETACLIREIKSRKIQFSTEAILYVSVATAFVLQKRKSPICGPDCGKKLGLELWQACFDIANLINTNDLFVYRPELGSPLIQNYFKTLEDVLIVKFTHGLAGRIKGPLASTLGAQFNRLPESKGLWITQNSAVDVLENLSQVEKVIGKNKEIAELKADYAKYLGVQKH